VDLCHGDLIGRLEGAALPLDDPRISEAHAMVSLRGGRLQLLALRGRLLVRRAAASEVILKPGVRITLVEGIVLTVEAVTLPETLLALDGLGPTPQRLLAPVCALLLSPRPMLVPRFVPDAPALFWTAGSRWRARVGDRPHRDLAPGDALEVGGRALTAVEIPIADGGRAATRMHLPMRIIARFDTVHIHRDGQPVLVLDGTPARLFCELVRFDGPVSWYVAAREIWRDTDDRDVLRMRWDRNLANLRRKLRAARVRPDLLRATGRGQIELLILEEDALVDEM